MFSDGTTHITGIAGSSSFLRWMVGCVALINLLVACMVAFSLYQSHGEFQEHAEITAQNMSKLLAYDIGGELDAINILLLSAADEIERQIAGGGIDRQALNAFLKRLQGRVPAISGLRATDANGIVRFGPGVDAMAHLNNSDREYFTRQRDNPKAGLVIAKPVFARIDKKWAVPISRPIHLPDGSFGGVVYVNFALEHLTKTFSTIDIGQHGSISLRDAEQRVFGAYPAPADFGNVIGEKLAVPELQELVQSGRNTGTYITHHTIDGIERKFAALRVDNFPLYVVVGRDTDEYMAQWKEQAIKTSVLAALFCTAMLISSWLIYRNWKNQSATNKQLRDLSSHLQTVREEEQTNIAREIHDELGGTLTSLKIDVYWLTDKLPANDEAAPVLEHIKSMSQLIDHAVSITRRIITDLRPTVLDDLGLLAAIEWQCEQFHQRTGIEYWVNCIEDKGKLDKQYSIALFRILQEALTNISRHSGATMVEVEFHHNDEEVILSIIDNGRGMPEDCVASPGSYGVRGMRERTEQLNGQIKFDTPPGGGFSVMVILPLSAKSNKEGRT